MASHEEIALLAKKMWVAAKKPSGQDTRFWLEAEEQLTRATRVENVKESVRMSAKQTGPMSCWDLAKEVVGKCDRVLLWGVSGTGKSWAARKINLPAGEDVYSVSLTEDTPAAELRGHYGLVEGNYKWLDGPCVMAWGRHGRGHRLNLNELEKASGDAQTYLLGILDDMEIAQQTLPTGEHLRPQDGFNVIATMNGHPDEDLNPALRDRFPVCIHIDKVAPAAINALAADLQTIATNAGIIAQSQRRMSVRCWNEYAKLRERIGPELAAQAVFGDKAKAVLDSLKVGAA